MRSDQWICCLLAALICGCRPAESDATRKMTAQLVSVTGTVLLDGKPLSRVAVNFHPANLADGGEAAVGVTDETGKYALSTSIPGSPQGPVAGALPGEYRVFITKLVMPDGSAVAADVTDADAEAMNARQLLPPKYSHFENSQLKGAVKPEPTVIDFELKGK